ncbi:hypothetical protein KKG90_06410 [Candidatus Bipolaricaulota bacterium]|nr:hypothetical protein [Candidatus Bipolaricaulota bacterium]
MTSRRRCIQFVSDALVQEIVDGRKTASVVDVGDVDVADGDYDDALVVGEFYDVYDSALTVRATIRIVAMELCRWDAIPERLWRGEGNVDADEFKKDHEDYFVNPDNDFEFIADDNKVIADDFEFIADDNKVIADDFEFIAYYFERALSED